MLLHTTRSFLVRGAARSSSSVMRMNQFMKNPMKMNQKIVTTSQLTISRSFSLSVLEKSNYDLQTSVVVTNRDAIRNDTGLRQFINRVYNYTGASVVGTIGLGLAMAQSVPAHPVLFLVGGAILSYGGIFGIQGSKFHIQRQMYQLPANPGHALDVSSHHHQHPNGIEVLSSTNSLARIASYGAFVTGMSMLTAPALLVYPDAIAPAFLASSSVFGSAALYAYSKPVGALNTWGPALYSALGGLVMSGFTGIVGQLLFGPNVISNCLFDVHLYGGIPLFAAFIAYDTQKAVEIYKEGLPDHLGCTVELYLDFMNLFVRFLEIFGKAQNNRD